MQEVPIVSHPVLAQVYSVSRVSSQALERVHESLLTISFHYCFDCMYMYIHYFHENKVCRTN